MFTEEQEQGAAAVADTAMTTDLDEDIRVDLTHLKVFTIDGAGASCSACVRVLRSAEWRNLNKGGRLENHVVKGGSQRQTHSWGVDNAVVCLSVVLSTPMNAIWRCKPPFTTMFRVKR